MRRTHCEQQLKSCRSQEKPAKDWRPPGLCWTSVRSKPASKQEVTIGKAEEFLASLLDEDENGPEATTGSQASSD